MTLLRELSRKRVLATFIFCVVCLTTIGVGIVWPLQYETTATLYVDERTIIEPLLEGQAEVQETDQAQEAKEKIYTRKILEKVARDAGLLDGDSNSKEIASTLGALGEGGIKITNSGQNYLRVSYRHSDPDTSFNVITALINAFIRNIAESKRQASKEAYEFIQDQVDMYKEQLKTAEKKLEAFHAQNKDGTEEAVQRKIDQLRTDIEDLQLQISEIKTRRDSIRAQLQNESEYLQVRNQSEVYRERIQEAQNRLDNMLVHLTETHPDVVSLRLQIEDHRQAIEEIEQQQNRSSSNESDLALNPLYEDLRSNLSETEIELRTAQNKLDSLKKILEEEYKRAERIASRRAELAELNRDYDVTKDLYEDMLNRKEKARLSMKLDIEGQGTSYKVHEPPTFPLTPTGLNAKHFMMAAPALGLLAPIGLIGAFVFLDPRIRIPTDLRLIHDCEILTTIPPKSQPSAGHGIRKDTMFCAMLFAACMAAYSWIALNKVLGGS